MTRVHVTADTNVWSGASTTALLAAKADAGSILLSAGNADLRRRMEQAGVVALACPMSGWFAALNISRVLRHLPGSEFEIYLHSPQVRHAFESALRLVGRSEPMRLMPDRPMPEFPSVEVSHPAPGSEPLLMWLGNITAGCNLRQVIEELGARADRPWRLRVVGQGEAKIVSPILKRTKALAIADRIEWVGLSLNPYEQMNGVSVGIVADKESIVAREFAAARIPIITNLSEIL